MPKFCPQCGYPLHRDNHPLLGIIRFCRRSCIRRWLTRHGLPATGWFDTHLVDQRR